jgi:hypothetical protein
MEQTLQRYALLKHVTDDTPSKDPGWIRMDSVVLNWISNSISVDLYQFLNNREQHTLYLDAVFHTFVQDDLLINEYCRKFKAMTDDLADLDAHVEDWILFLNILQGLNQRFEHVGSIIRRYSPFPNFLKVWDDLLLEELHMDNTEPPAALTTLYTNIASPAAKPPSSTPSRLSMVATVATGPSTTTKTTIAVMAAATMARTAPTVEVVGALLARPPPPLVFMAGPTHRGRPTATRGRGT